MTPDDVRYILSAIRALLGHITANTRAVMLGWDQSTVRLRFVTFDEPTEYDRECMSCAATEILADFPSMGIAETIGASSRYPRDLGELEHPHWVFFRAEGAEVEEGSDSGRTPS